MIRSKTALKGGGFMATLALCTILALVSCLADTNDWYPSASATIVSHYEYSNSVGKGVVTTIEIANSGLSSINRCTVSISAATQARAYRLTAVKDIVIPPGKRAYFDMEIAFVSEDEALKESGLTIEDSFYL